jgi:hypothetical protein
MTGAAWKSGSTATSSPFGREGLVFVSSAEMIHGGYRIFVAAVGSGHQDDDMVAGIAPIK